MFTKLAVMAGVLAGACLLGAVRSARLLARNPSTTLGLVHQHLAEALPLLAFCLASTGAAVYAFTHSSALWLIPAAIDPWSLTLLCACSAGPFAYLLAIALRVAHRSNDPKRHQLACAGTILLLALSPVYILYSRPICRDLGDARAQDGAVLQTSPFSCVPAAAANALAALDVASSERELARLAGTTILGTSPGEIIAALRLKGVSARKAMLSAGELRRLSAPALLLVDYPGLGPLSHAILFERLEGDFAHVVDPLTGRAKLKLSALEQQWHGHAICLLQSPR